MSDAYGPNWVNVNLMIYPSTMEIHAVGGDREEGQGDTKYIGLELIKSQIQSLKQELAELQQTFDLQWKCDQRAIEMWQEETGKDLTWPDGAVLIVWLLEQLASCQKDRAFFKCCALSGEIPREGSEPSAQTDITKGE